MQLETKDNWQFSEVETISKVHSMYYLKLFKGHLTISSNIRQILTSSLIQ